MSIRKLSYNRVALIDYLDLGPDRTVMCSDRTILSAKIVGGDENTKYEWDQLEGATVSWITDTHRRKVAFISAIRDYKVFRFYINRGEDGEVFKDLVVSGTPIDNNERVYSHAYASSSVKNSAEFVLELNSTYFKFPFVVFGKAVYNPSYYYLELPTYLIAEREDLQTVDVLQGSGRTYDYVRVFRTGNEDRVTTPVKVIKDRVYRVIYNYGKTKAHQSYSSRSYRFDIPNIIFANDQVTVPLDENKFFFTKEVKEDELIFSTGADSIAPYHLSSHTSLEKIYGEFTKDREGSSDSVIIGFSSDYSVLSKDVRYVTKGSIGG